MNRWPSVALSDIFDIARGGSPRPIDEYITEDPDGINWIMIGDASAGSKYITSTKKRIKVSGACRSRYVKAGDFLLTNSMSFGHPYILRTHGCIHDGWLVLSPKREDIFQDYFYHLLGSPAVYSEFQRLAAGATVKNLNIDLVNGVEVTLPPLIEQFRIAAILDQADSLRRLRQRAIDRLNTLGQAIFHEMFVSAEDSRWPKTKIRDIASDIRTGPFGSQLLHSEFVDDGIPVLGIDNAVNNEFFWAKPRHITQIKYQQLKRYTVRPGDVLITLMGTCGRCAIVPADVPTAINTKHLCCITLDQTQALSEFLHAAFLMHPGILSQLGVEAKGAVMPGLNMGIIKNLELPLPPLALQRAFMGRTEVLRNTREHMRLHLGRLDAAFSSLQHRAFRGEL